MTKELKLWTRPDSYVGAEWPEYYVVIGIHRDSPLLDVCNFEVVKRELEAIEAKYPEWVNPTIADNLRESDDDSAMVVNPYESHWAVGHVEWIGIHKDSPVELIAKAQELLDRLDDYPILDEDDFSEREWTQAQEFWSGMTLKERVDVCRRNRVSIFAARHDWIPQDDNGGIFDYCRPE